MTELASQLETAQDCVIVAGDLDSEYIVAKIFYPTHELIEVRVISTASVSVVCDAIGFVPSGAVPFAVYVPETPLLDPNSVELVMTFIRTSEDITVGP